VAIAVAVLLLSGAVLYVPALSQAVGQRFWVRGAHLVAAAALALGPGLLALARPLRTIALERELSWWDRADADWLLRPWRVLAGRMVGPVAAAGRFNAGQKLFAALVAVALGTLALTGVPMAWWSWFGAPVVARAHDIHVVAALALVPLLAGHVYLGLCSPYGMLARRRRDAPGVSAESADP
jgi:formate dehydrogenase subunit gamma